MTIALTAKQKISLGLILFMALLRIADNIYGNLLPHSLRYLPLIFLFTGCSIATFLLFQISNKKEKGFLVLYIILFALFLILPFFN